MFDVLIHELDIVAPDFPKNDPEVMAPEKDLDRRKNALKLALKTKDIAAAEKANQKGMTVDNKKWEERYEITASFIDRLPAKAVMALEETMDILKDGTRLSGEPKVYHCLSVARILSETFKVEDEDILTAAILHDNLEDLEDTSAVNMSLEAAKMQEKYGVKTARLVYGLTKHKYEKVVMDEITYRNVMREARENPEILLIKLADRLHNWETIGGQNKLEKRVEAAVETMEFFIPIAKKIGASEIEERLKGYVQKVEDEVNKDKDPGEKVEIVGTHTALVEEELDRVFEIVSRRNQKNKLVVRDNLKKLREIMHPKTPVNGPASRDLTELV